MRMYNKLGIVAICENVIMQLNSAWECQTVPLNNDPSLREERENEAKMNTEIK